MQITDLMGNKLTVTDLDKALHHAELFQDFRHTDKSYAGLDKRLTEYWSDIHAKLLKIKQNPSQESCRPVS